MSFLIETRSDLDDLKTGRVIVDSSGRWWCAGTSLRNVRRFYGFDGIPCEPNSVELPARVMGIER